MMSHATEWVIAIGLTEAGIRRILLLLGVVGLTNTTLCVALKCSRSSVFRQDDRAVDHDVKRHTRSNLQCG
jgi:hypothetical protein